MASEHLTTEQIRALCDGYESRKDKEPFIPSMLMEYDDLDVFIDCARKVADLRDAVADVMEGNDAD